MATPENLSIDEADDRGLSCKPRKRFLILLLTTITAVSTLVVMGVVIAPLQSPTPLEGPTTPVTAVSAETKSSPAANKEIEPTVYFATLGGGLQSYSFATSEVRNYTGSFARYVYGVTYDSVHDKLYWSASGPMGIWRGNRDGSDVEVVLSTNKYSSIYGLDFDWITSTIYVVTHNGFILVCQTIIDRRFTCVEALKGQGNLRGIALNPTAGLMYYTVDYYRGSGFISRAGMDGSNSSVIVRFLNAPHGIKVDLQTSRLYWACHGDSKVQSSTLEGGDIKTIVQRPSGSATLGIAVSGGRIYWTNYLAKTLESSTPTGNDLRLLHSSATSLRHLAVVPLMDIPNSRVNDCAGQTCSKVCVLSTTSFRCLS